MNGGAGGSGTSGTSGASGSSGSSGQSGTSGSSGSSGTSATAGSSGTSGSGSPGSSGSSGATGSSGSSGTSGSSGESGTSGSSGATGTPGSSGTSGAGAAGTQGTSGSSGVSGTATLQTGSLAKQTILYNVISGSQNTITGLNLSGNKWGIDIKEEWDAVITAGDQYYNSCSLLLHCDGTNGSTTFTDNSPSPKTVTAYNGAAISTAQSKFGGASGLFDGTNDYLSIPNNAEFNFASGTFTVEFWVYFSSVSGQRALVSTYQNSANGWTVQLYLGVVSVNLSGDGFDIAGTTTISANTWYHIAVSGTPGSYKLFLNGVQEGSTYTGGTALSSTSALTIGQIVSSVYFNGYIDELRITKGVARYTGNFTPQTSAFPNNTSVTQYATKYVGLIGGLNDKSVDYGVQKLSDSSLKVVKMTQTTSPFPSGSLSSSVDRVYVNVLDYTNVSVTSSYATNALNSINSLDIPKIKSIIYTNSGYTPTTASAVDLVKGNNYIIISGSNFKSSASVFIDATTGSIVSYVNANKLNVNVATKAAGTYPIYLMNTDGASTFKINAITYISGLSGTQKAIFGYGYTSANVSMTNLVSNTGVVATDTTGVGTDRRSPSASGYGSDKAIFGYGYSSANVSMTNLVSNTGVVATDTTGVGTARREPASARYGSDKAIFGYGNTSTQVSMTNLVSNTGVVATDTTGVGTARYVLAAAGYGTDKAIFGYGYTGANVSMTNLVSNTGVVATDTTGVGTARYYLAAAGYGTDKAIFGYGTTGANVSMTNLVSNTGVVATDTTGVGTARNALAAAGYGSDKAIFGYGSNGGGNLSMTNLVSNTGVVATDTTGVGTVRDRLAAAGYSTT